MNGPVQAFIGLGSNLGDPVLQLSRALDALAGLPQTELVAPSRFYRTAPWGVLEQPSFVNAVVQLRTALHPEALLASLLDIERAAGRVRIGERWGPRVLDLDILHIEGVRQDSPSLTLPHPRIAERAFVLLPLHELAPQLELPGQGVVSALLEQVDTTGCHVLP